MAKIGPVVVEITTAEGDTIKFTSQPTDVPEAYLTTGAVMALKSCHRSASQCWTSKTLKIDRPFRRV